MFGPLQLILRLQWILNWHQERQLLKETKVREEPLLDETKAREECILNETQAREAEMRMLRDKIDRQQD